ncbi:thioester domain-containing protein [Agromyces mediolanus]|uniref:thioester domain-containing protein n=1 Tax=Agromyces mediolanus TaxID=41986 RepID=UPI00203C9D01|nr:thioester domain-containing protein [Agromyces mediolanus]MCM3657563.1 thioester domain-containing protein [Agromyces mediolanus]
MNPILSLPMRALVALLALFALLASLSVLPAGPARADDATEGYPRLGAGSESRMGHPIAWSGSRAFPQLFALYSRPGDQPDLFAYCIEVLVPAGFGDGLAVGGWDTFPGDNRFATDERVREQVSWIIANSYPTLSLSEYAAATGLPGLTREEAITGTQVAIWQLTDAAPAPAAFEYRGLATRGGIDVASPAAQRVQALVDHLTGDANVGLAESVLPELTLDPAVQQGDAGSLVGPVTITATAGELLLSSSSDDPLVTADGTPVDPTAPPRDTALFLDVPADAAAGSATLTARLTGVAHEGLLLSSADPAVRRQTLIIADSGRSSVEASAALSWLGGHTPPERPEEPGTPSTPPTPAGPGTPVTPSTPPTGTPEHPAPVPRTADAAPVANTDGRLAETGADPLLPALGAVALFAAGTLVMLIRRLQRGRRELA